MAVGALLAVLAGGSQPAQAAFVVGQNFTGISLSDGNGAIPPDTMGAVGPSDFVELLNTRYAVYDKSTGSQVAAMNQDDFWKAAGVTFTGNDGPFDPRVVFDQNSGHWFATALAGGETANSRYLVAVSNTSDPTQGWKAFSYKADPNSIRWSDFDTLGLNGDGLYVATNFIPVDTTSMLPEQTAVLALNKANLIAGAPTGTLFDNIDPNSTGFSIQPVTNLDNGPTPELLYSAYNGAATINNTTVGLFKRSAIVGPNEGNALAIADPADFLQMAPWGEPGTAAQPGGDNTLNTGDSRMSSSLTEVNGKLWGVHTVLNGSHSALLWFRIDAATGNLEEQGVIGDNTSDYYYGSIAVNPRGFVVIGYTRSSATEFASSYASTGTFDGMTTTFNPPVLLKAGTAAYDIVDNLNRNRWGDYSATTLDPANSDIFWTVQEWSAGPTNWSTQVTELFDPVPEPAGVVLLALGMLPLLLTSRRAARRRGVGA